MMPFWAGGLLEAEGQLVGGSPNAGGGTMQERITIRLTAEMKAAPVRPRQDAFRYIIEDWLIGHGYLSLPSNMRDRGNLGSGQPAGPLLPKPPPGS